MSMMNLNNNSPGSPPKKEPIRRPRKACTKCRSLKTRCLPDGDNRDPLSCCSRCARLNLVCEYSRAKRGRPPKKEPPTNQGTSTQHRQVLGGTLGSANSAWGLSNGHRRSPVPSTAEQSYALSSSAPEQHSLLPHTSPDINFLSSTWGGTSTHLAQGGHLLATVHSQTHARNGSLDLGQSPPIPFSNGGGLGDTGTSENSLLPSPHGSVNTLDGLFRGGNVYRDPIELGLVSEAEAQYFFKQFMANVAPLSGIFDEHYHTYTRIRSSPVLFSAVLFASTRFYGSNPDISIRIKAHTELLLQRTVFSGDVNLTVAQAILVLVYWMSPGDSAYQKLGIAVRIMCQLRSQWPFSSPENLTEEGQRELADKERTYMNVVGLDIMLAAKLQLPPCNVLQRPSPQQTVQWVEKNRHLGVQGDCFKEVLANLWDIYLEFADFPRFGNEEKHIKLVPWLQGKEKHCIDMLRHLERPDSRNTISLLDDTTAWQGSTLGAPDTPVGEWWMNAAAWDAAMPQAGVSPPEPSILGNPSVMQPRPMHDNHHTRNGF